ncbi:hypothetical protein [Neoroseomonas lacus]|uniref:hypothetical protein n=1 Tax=Neoroseomonas lacus TaxID=287609 RepID=UPI00166B7AAB|nr:hypothetical protein [Neoroseomonas lacus]
MAADALPAGEDTDVERRAPLRVEHAAIGQFDMLAAEQAGAAIERDRVGMQVGLPEQFPHHQDQALIGVAETHPVRGEVVLDARGIGTTAGFHRIGRGQAWHGAASHECRTSLHTKCVHDNVIYSQKMHIDW